MRPPFTIAGGRGQLVATALHAGHDIRPEVAEVIALDDATRRREEDPGTDRVATLVPLRAVAHRSRFEVDLNRPRHEAVYRHPDDAWGLKIWRDEAVVIGKSSATRREPAASSSAPSNRGVLCQSCNSAKRDR